MPINCKLSNLVITLCLLNFIGGGSGIMKDGLKKKMNKEYLAVRACGIKNFIVFVKDGRIRKNEYRLKILITSKKNGRNQ